MRSLIKRWSKEADPIPGVPEVPAGERLYAIGDIHGSLAALQEMHELIQQDAETYPGNKTIVYLGDYIDRGEHSRQVIDLLLEAPLPGFNAIHLLGNHEKSLLDFLEYPRLVAAWLSYGGRATLHSYGVRASVDFRIEHLDVLRDDLARQLPESHLEFYRSLKTYHVAGSYCFVHAGIRPGVPLHEQRNEDLLWIRDDFTRSQVRHEHIVVHGHSITNEVDWRNNRIGIDTGAFHSGVLSCLVLEGSARRLLQTGEPARKKHS